MGRLRNRFMVQSMSLSGPAQLNAAVLLRVRTLVPLQGDVPPYDGCHWHVDDIYREIFFHALELTGPFAVEVVALCRVHAQM